MHKFFTRDKAGSGFSSRFLFTAPENLAMPHWVGLGDRPRTDRTV